MLTRDYRLTPEGLVYTVAPHETLSSIAQRFTGRVTNWRAIGKINHIANDRRIPIGKQVLIPAHLLPEVPAQASVRSAAGRVTILGKDGELIEPQPDLQLTEGMLLITGPDGFVSLVLDDGTRFTVYPDSRLGLRFLRASQVTGEPRTRLFLEQGRIESHVAPHQNKDSKHYEVISPVSVSSVRGTVFRTGVASGSAVNEVLEGRVAVSGAGSNAGGGGPNQGESRIVGAGFGTVVAGGRVAPPVSLLTPPELANGYAVQQRLPLQFNLRHANARAFRVAVSMDAEGSEMIATAATEAASGTGIAKVADLPDGDYYLRVHGVDEGGLWGQARSAPFRVDARPFPPMLLQPPEKVQVSQPDKAEPVVMKWAQSEEASSYRLQVAADPSFASPLVDQLVTGGIATETVALPPGNYVWRVAAITKNNGEMDQGPFGDLRRVQVLEAMKAPTIVHDDKETRITWIGRPGQQFTFQISDQPTFERLLVDQVVDQPAAVLPSLGSGIYYARVRSIDSDGFIGVFSPAQRFVIPTYWQSSFGGPLKSQAGPVSPGF